MKRESAVFVYFWRMKACESAHAYVYACARVCATDGRVVRWSESVHYLFCKVCIGNGRSLAVEPWPIRLADTAIEVVDSAAFA